MDDVKRYGHISHLVEAIPAMVELYPSMTIYTLAYDFDAQRLRADTAEADSLRKDCIIEDMIQSNSDMTTCLAAAEQRIADQFALLLKCKEVFDNCSGMSDQKTRVDWYANYLVPTKVDLNAALNPKPEAGSHE